MAAQTQQLNLANQSAAQATATDTQQIQSTLGDATTNLARLFGANAITGGLSPLVGASTTGAAK